MMNSELVIQGEQSVSGRLHSLNPFSLFRRFILRRPPLSLDDVAALEKKRLLSSALTRREQEAYERALSVEREIQQSTLQSTRASFARAHRDLEAASGIVLDSGVREAKRLGRIFYEARQKQQVQAIPRPVAIR